MWKAKIFKLHKEIHNSKVSEMQKILKTQTSKEKIDTLTTLKFKILQIKRHQEISIVSSLNCININL